MDNRPDSRENGLVARRPQKGAILNQLHRRKRLTWSARTQYFTSLECFQFLWTDESCFSLFTADGRARVAISWSSKFPRKYCWARPVEVAKFDGLGWIFNELLDGSGFDWRFAHCKWVHHPDSGDRSCAIFSQLFFQMLDFFDKTTPDLAKLCGPPNSESFTRKQPQCDPLACSVPRFKPPWESMGPHEQKNEKKEPTDSCWTR